VILTVLGLAHRDANRVQWVTVRCSCGRVFDVRQYCVTSGKTTSCGCRRINTLRAMHTTHGDSSSSEYRIWTLMKNRCLNTEADDYPRYGGRGIRVCPRWVNSYENFLDDMGRRPDGRYSIERVDNHGDYAPTNCHWALPKEQSRNRRSNRYVVLEGRRMCFVEACETYKVLRENARDRIERGWSVEEAFELIKRERGRVVLNLPSSPP
jgi:hypothetical protein